jgi:hypothetical protein
VGVWLTVCVWQGKCGLEGASLDEVAVVLEHNHIGTRRIRLGQRVGR